MPAWVHTIGGMFAAENRSKAEADRIEKEVEARMLAAAQCVTRPSAMSPTPDPTLSLAMSSRDERIAALEAELAALRAETEEDELVVPRTRTTTQLCAELLLADFGIAYQTDENIKFMVDRIFRAVREIKGDKGKGQGNKGKDQGKIPGKKRRIDF